MRKKIKIVHIIPSLAAGGGAERVVYNLCRFLDKDCFEPEVLFWGADDLAQPIEVAGCSVFRLPLRNVVSFDSLRLIIRILRERKGNLVHTHLMDADLLGGIAARVVRIPVITQIHSYPFPVLGRHALRYRGLSWGDTKVVCVSRHVRDYVRRTTGIRQDKLSVIYNGIDRERFSRQISSGEKYSLRKSIGLEPDDIVVGNVSRLIPEKGHDCLLKAFAQVFQSRQRGKLLIVGDGPLRESLVDLAVRLGIGNRVVFVGQRQDVAELLDCMDVFVLPAWNEAFGLSVVEAMAAGLPIVSVDDAAIPEIISHGQEGLLVAPKDNAGLAESILKLMDHSGMAANMAQAAFMRSLDFTAQGMTKKFESIYSGATGL